MNDKRLACAGLMFGGFGVCLGAILSVQAGPPPAYGVGCLFLFAGVVCCGRLNAAGGEVGR